MSRALFFGFGDAGGKCLRLLLDEGLEIPAVFTHDADLHETQCLETPEEIAKERGIPVYKPKSLKTPEWAGLAEKLKPDLLLCVFYRSMIPEEIFTKAALGAYNLHGSYLPYYRGRAPLNWALINGESFGGASLHVMEKGFDTGGIVAQERVDFGADEYAGDIQPRITLAALKVLRRALPEILSGAPKLTPQDEGKASYFGRRRPEDGRLDFSGSAREAFNMVRALGRPFPGAWTAEVFPGKTLVWRARPLDGAQAAKLSKISESDISSAPPAALICQNPPIVKCADGCLLFEEYETV